VLCLVKARDVKRSWEERDNTILGGGLNCDRLFIVVDPTNIERDTFLIPIFLN